jgi:hypothetical protein
MSIRNNFFLACLLSFAVLPAFAQNLNNSAYSQFGIGDLLPPAFIGQAGMAGVGVSHTNGIYINNINPALLARNRNTVLDFGLVGQYKQIKSNTQEQTSFAGNLQYLGFAFPVNSHWTTSLTLMPYTSVSYNVRTSGNLSNSAATVNYNFRGKGGLNRLDWGNGVLLGKNWYVGAKFSYIFGGISKEEVTQILPTSVPGSVILNNYITNSTRKINVNDLTAKLGVAYRKQVRDKIFANVGLTYDMASSLNARQITTVQLQDRNETPITIDTLGSEKNGTVYFPSQLRAGISLDKPFNWMIGLDVSYINGSAFRDFEGNAGLENGYSVALGGEYIPNISSVSEYFNRVAYKAGLSYTLTPYFVGNTQIEDVSLSLGMALPVSRSVSDLNLALALGQRGTLQGGLIRERYLRLNLGITINDRWFQRRRID